MDVDRRESGLFSSGEDEEAELPSTGVVTHTKSDSEWTTMLSWATAGTGLEWNPLPCPEHLRLNDWFLSVVHSHVPLQCLFAGA